MKSPIALFVGLLLLFAAYHAISQGDLDPPGVPTPTMKTLHQIEPRIDIATLPGDADSHHLIDEPGSYYLSGNLDVTKTNGLDVRDAGVTIDLNGFEIRRVLGSGGNGIQIGNGGDRCVVKNGSLQGFASGIRTVNVASALPHAGSFIDLSVSRCSSFGLWSGDGWQIDGCKVQGMERGWGIYANRGCIVTNCSVSDGAGDYGFFASSGCTLVNCTAYGNNLDSAAIRGRNSTMENCAVYENTVPYGIEAESACNLTNCSATDNESEIGIRAGSGSTLSNCTGSGNTSSESSSYGIHAISACAIVNSTASSNTNTGPDGEGHGIFASFGTLVEQCVANSNQGDGIVCDTKTTIRNNQCWSNGLRGDGAGIRAISDDNRIEGNQVVAADRGIDVDGTGNLILRNSASGNTTNFDIVADNRYGPVVNLTATGTAAASGNAGPDTVGIHPWTNFAY